MQVDTPLQLYHYPANRFVAGFIGSPAMNFLTGRLYCDGQYYFSGEKEEFNISLGTEIPEELKAYCNKELTAGIRPEYLQLTDADIEGASFVLKVNAFENMGNEQLIYLTMGDRLLIARRSSSDMQGIGESVAVKVMANKIIFFDTGSGIRVG